MRTICLKFKSCLAFTRLGFKHPVLPNLCVSIHHLDATSPREIFIALPKQLDLGTKTSVLELSPGNSCVLSSVWAQAEYEIPLSCVVSSISGWVGVRKLSSNQTLFSNFSDFYLQGSPIGWVQAVDSKKSDGASTHDCNLAVMALPQCKFTAVPPQLCWDRNPKFRSTRDRLERSIGYLFFKKIQIFQQFFS